MNIDWWRLLPPYWLQNEPTCWDWDAALNELLDSDAPITCGEHSCEIAGVPIWAGNYPYSYGSYYPSFGGARPLPSVATRKRLHRVIGEARRKEIREAISKAKGEAS